MESHVDDINIKKVLADIHTLDIIRPNITAHLRISFSRILLYFLKASAIYLLYFLPDSFQLANSLFSSVLFVCFVVYLPVVLLYLYTTGTNMTVPVKLVSFPQDSFSK